MSKLRDHWGRFHKHEWREESRRISTCHSRYASKDEFCSCGVSRTVPIQPECSKCKALAEYVEFLKSPRAKHLKGAVPIALNLSVILARVEAP